MVISLDDLESLKETLDIMDSSQLLDDIRESLAELGASDVPVLTGEEALNLTADR
jgi:PHD/YefM family antitoxin component YafN of YafNO toxin-antitoxin module